MKDWKKTIIHPDTPIREAMQIINTTDIQIALVNDEQSRLVGVITDGDIRRGLLEVISLDAPVNLIMNRNFTSVGPSASREEILRLMKLKVLRQIPVLDDQGRVVDLKLLVEMIQLAPRDNWVMLMGGGLGTRLRPLTDDCPKPLLKVGNKPVLETILENFIEYGFHKFYISVNYKAKMIENTLGDGSRWDASIRYLREEMPLGTAGALGLLPKRPELPLIVMNADVLSKVNIQHLLDFHQCHKAIATMCVWEYHFQVPYGVVKTDQHRLIGIDEKPRQRFFVNAGVYILEPEVLDFVPKNTFLDMTNLFERLIDQGCETAAFPIWEYWVDIGRPADLERANGEFGGIFT
ncbi:MAG: nucleotidyltransferase family protein [Proteobacteria bacterium]|nr:nucleotidyltransferase family protein [Pseudomonadota bacterium]